jgi:hypothetical protein
MRTSSKRLRTPKAAKANPTPNPDAPVSNELIDHWRSVRTVRAHTPAGFTTIADLHHDFSAWHEGTYPDLPIPSENSFAIALAGVPRIRIETLKARVMGVARNTSCASLTLNNPIRAWAA